MFLNRRCCAQPMPAEMDRNCGCGNGPIVEPTINKCVEREFCHEVPHVCPIHTHVINKHIYRHTYTPEYTCSEENQVINLDNNGCCGLANNNNMMQ